LMSELTLLWRQTHRHLQEAHRMNAHILLDAVVQQTTVFIAQLATAGGVRAPLTRVANQVFLDLSQELYQQGLKKNVIADMFGMTLRTYHRKMRELSQSQSIEGRSIWEAVLEFVREREPVAAGEVHHRFVRDERDVVAGVLNDLVNSGLCYRSGRGNDAVYRFADATDFAQGQEASRQVASEYLVWQTVYRQGPVTIDQLIETTRLGEAVCHQALGSLLGDGRVRRLGGEPASYASDQIEVPVGHENGWEAAVFDHFQAMVSAICAKLSAGAGRSTKADRTGGATFSLDLWPGHPLEEEALGSLARVRDMLEDLRARLDQINAESGKAPTERLIFYVGQHFKSDLPLEYET
jgi:hypothetical protein